MEENPIQGAEWIKNQLMEEWPDLFIEVEDGLTPVLKIYGTRELVEKQAKRRAEDLKGQRKVEVEVKLVGYVTCSKSAPVKTTRNVDEPVQQAASPVEEDRRGVWLMCNNADRHAVIHGWGGYQPLPK